MLAKRYLGWALSLLALSVPAHADSTAKVEFLTPSRNIYCTADAQGIACMLLRHDPAPSRRPADCDLDWTSTVELGRMGAAKHGGWCHGDMPENPDAQVLAYGKTVRGEGWRCTAEESGLRCENASGRGFRLSRRAKQLF